LVEATQQLEEAGIENPRFEAQLLLGLALGVSRVAILAGTHPEPTEAQQQEFARLIEARARRVPLAYLRGTQEFYGLPFRVSPAVLVPRPETELLVDFARETLPGDMGVLADVGTGSGCIAIATLAHCPQAQGVAFDLSPDALALARHNALHNGVETRLRFARADLLTGAATDAYDVIVSNPPYIPTAQIPTLQAEVRDYEPRLALDGGPDGLEALRRLAAESSRALRPGGWLAVEVAIGQAADVADFLRAHRLTSVATRADLAGIERLVCGQKR
jgi:release factor glutamine methyltransferase